MNRLAVIAKRYSYAATAALLSVAMLLPMLVSGNASADQLEIRSVKPSSSVAGATAVSYEIKFTASAGSASINSVVVDFCNAASGPISGMACVAPAGMTRGTTLTSATIAAADVTADWAVSNVTSTNAILLTRSAGVTAVAGSELVFTVSGFTNSTVADTVYPRIFTYTATPTYTSVAPGTFEDNGSAAFALTEEIDVTAIVRETLTFCVSGTAIADGCADPSTPKVNLGVDQGDGLTFVIDDQDVYTGNVYYQLSTNAANGTNIQLKGASTALTSGSNSIASTATPAAIASGDEAFGIRVTAFGAVADPEDGDDLIAVPSSNFADPASTAGYYSVPAAVTSTYGAAFARAEAGVRNANGSLVFAASAAANTKAGIYKASYNMIATPSY